ncbi:50S ribosomal protein L25/general stress protein Ctc [Gordonia phthalatica]|uniref:Large ribosomal subunit protein bL25 n=1 Tax=Gordonia phthalatica TaxID=1136941 RepID=A0A0N9N1D8_9ACTN|nr:50S ribosomal protein L25/general stress protein Ctc [Gordonia phthalatica]ALG83937.1 50S ribosomal protein L25 [Gordonia phthalatica]
MATAPQLATTIRTDKGKGAARRARNAGQVPAVLYGHGTDPKHLLLPNRDLTAILRNNGTNAVVELDIEGAKQLALTKQVDVHPLRNYVEHVDLLIVKRGEKVVVEVNLLIEGDPFSGSLVVQEASTVEIEADALSIPEHIVVSVEGREPGALITAGDLELPGGSTLITDPEATLVAVEAPRADATEDDEDDEDDAEAAAE